MAEEPYPPTLDRQPKPGSYPQRHGLRIADNTLFFEGIALVELSSVAGLYPSASDRLMQLVEEIDGCPDLRAAADRLPGAAAETEAVAPEKLYSAPIRGGMAELPKRVAKVRPGFPDAMFAEYKVEVADDLPPGVLAITGFERNGAFVATGMFTRD